MRSGEFWIENDGTSLYADGDIGDYNHETYVIQYVQSEYADYEFSKGEYVDWEGFKAALAKQVYQQKLQQIIDPQKQKQLTQEFEYDPEPFMLEGLKEKGMTNEEYQIAEGMGDPRQFAMKNWGWKRVVDENIETWTLIRNDLDALAKGLWDAYQESAEGGRYHIYVYGNRSDYTNVPYIAIESRNVNDLRNYQHHFESFKIWFEQIFEDDNVIIRDASPDEIPKLFIHRTNDPQDAISIKKNGFDLRKFGRTAGPADLCSHDPKGVYALAMTDLSRNQDQRPYVIFSANIKKAIILEPKDWVLHPKKCLSVYFKGKIGGELRSHLLQQGYQAILRPNSEQIILDPDIITIVNIGNV